MQVEVGHLCAEELPRERFSRPQCVLRSDDRSDVSSDGVAEQFTSCIVEPANASPAVEDVGRDGDSFQRGPKIARRRVQFGEQILAGSVCPVRWDAPGRIIPDLSYVVTGG